MPTTIVVHRGRTEKLPVQLAYDVSQDTITSQIRRGRSVNSPLIAEWDVSYRTDGKDGLIDLVLDDSVTILIDADMGYMDLKRVTGGEPVSVFKEPLQVVFKTVVTA